MARPRIAITTGPGTDADEGIYTRLRLDYVRAVDKAGGIPLVITGVRPEDAGAILDSCDALLLSGGPDVAPELFGEAPHEKLGSVVRERDDYEIALAREAVARDTPLLAICRGIQVLNVAFGGTLVQDIPSEVETTLNHAHPGARTDVAHDVEIEPGARLESLLRARRTGVNSFHHQSIDRVAPRLAVTGRSPEDRVVEAVEMKDRAFVVGVQWHPENFWRTGEFDALFAGLVRAARPTPSST
jgi:putative glutamine amidotransferase